MSSRHVLTELSDPDYFPAVWNDGRGRRGLAGRPITEKSMAYFFSISPQGRIAASASLTQRFSMCSSSAKGREKSSRLICRLGKRYIRNQSNARSLHKILYLPAVEFDVMHRKFLIYLLRAISNFYLFICVALNNRTYAL